MTGRKTEILVFCSIVLGILIAGMALSEMPKAEGSSLYPSSPATGISSTVNSRQDLSEAQTPSLIINPAGPDLTATTESTPDSGQQDSWTMKTQTGLQTWHFDVNTSLYTPDEYVVTATAIQPHISAMAFVSILERPSGYPDESSLDTGEISVLPANCNTSGLDIDPIPVHYVGDNFTITGTTNLEPYDKILVEIYPVSFGPADKSNGGESGGTTGMVNVTVS